MLKAKRQVFRGRLFLGPGIDTLDYLAYVIAFTTGRTFFKRFFPEKHRFSFFNYTAIMVK